MRNDESSLKKVIELVDMKLKQDDVKESKNFQDQLKSFGKLTSNDQFTSTFWPGLSINPLSIISNFSELLKISGNSSGISSFNIIPLLLN